MKIEKFIGNRILFAEFIKKIRRFLKNFKFYNKKTYKQFFLILTIYKPSLRSRDFHQKFGPDRFSRFDVYWVQTNIQTPKLNLSID